jgi:hypothetical protein
MFPTSVLSLERGVEIWKIKETVSDVARKNYQNHSAPES